MKRIISVLLLLVVFASIVPVYGFAVNDDVVSISYFEDGSYLVETFSERQLRASGSKAGTKSTTYHSQDGTALWKATLTGTFTYTGSSATCTGSSCNVTIYNSEWYTISKSATKSGNIAYASVTMGKKLLGVTVAQMPASVSIKCDANGNLS